MYSVRPAVTSILYAVYYPEECEIIISGGGQEPVREKQFLKDISKHRQTENVII